LNLSSALSARKPLIVCQFARFLNSELAIMYVPRSFFLLSLRVTVSPDYEGGLRFLQHLHSNLFAQLFKYGMTFIDSYCPA
jgi:hypothetical protein